jgi:hypothetical protein
MLKPADAGSAAADTAMLSASTAAAVRFIVFRNRIIFTSCFVVFPSFILPPPPIGFSIAFVNNLLGKYLSFFYKKAAGSHLPCSGASDLSIDPSESAALISHTFSHRVCLF